MEKISYANEAESEYRAQLAKLRTEFEEKARLLSESYQAEALKLKEATLNELFAEREKHRRSDEPDSFKLAQEFNTRWEKFKNRSIPRFDAVSSTNHKSMMEKIANLKDELDSCLGLNRQLLDNPGCESVIDEKRIASWTVESGDWHARNMPPRTSRGKYHFFAGNCKYGTLSQRVDVSSASKLIDEGSLEFSAQVHLFCLGQEPPDTGEFIVELLDSESSTIKSFTSGRVFHKDTWKRVNLSEPIPPRTRYVLVRLIAHRTGPRGSRANNAEFDDASLVITRLNEK